MIVYKFGGASVKNSDGIRNLSKIVSEANAPICVVVSAMGKTTNALECVVRTLFDGKASEAYELLNSTVIVPHLATARQLGLDTQKLENEIDNLKDSFQMVSHGHGQLYDKVYDCIVSYGEVLSTRIVADYLQLAGNDAHWLDMRKLLRTDSTFREANVVIRDSQKLLLNAIADEPHNIYVLQGFIGANSQGNPTTLGREGSDYTAALVGNMTDAESVTIWKDVPGILNADPRVMKDAVLIPELTYYDAVELAYSGAQVIHPKTIRPLENKSIPLYVKPFMEPDAKGSVIAGTKKCRIEVPVVIRRNNLTLITIRPLDFAFVMEESLPNIFSVLKQHNLKVSIIQSSAVTISIAVDNSSHIEEAIEFLRASYRVSYNQGLTLLTIRQTNKEIERRLKPETQIMIEQRTRNTVKFLYRTLQDTKE